MELIVQGAGWGDRAGRASAEARCSDEQKSAEDKRNEIHLRALQLFHHFGAVWEGIKNEEEGSSQGALSEHAELELRSC